MNVEILYEEARGCGYRKPSAGGVGIYLVGEGVFERCERLPFPLTTCPCCGAGYTYSRGWSWIHPMTLFSETAQPRCTDLEDPHDPHDHVRCSLCNPPIGQHGLIWIGESFYKTSDDFMAEARRMGISRKISAVPHGFVPGQTVVYLAHRKVPMIEGNALVHGQAVFSAFKPRGIDLVVEDAEDVPDKAINLAKSLGDFARIVKVIHEENAGEEIEQW